MTGSALLATISQYRRQGVLLDTNILVLLVVGRAEPTLVGRYSRVSQFTADDLDLLERVIAQFAGLSTTPHVLTEVNSLTNHLKGDSKSRAATVLAELSLTCVELYTPASTLTTRSGYIDLGLTDAAILEPAESAPLVLTDDFRLAGKLAAQGRAVLNFNHIRSLRMLPE
jgi:hypothetical protein